MRLLPILLLLFSFGLAKKSGGGVGGRVAPRPIPVQPVPAPVQPSPGPSLPLPIPAYPPVYIFPGGGGGGGGFSLLPLLVFMGLLVIGIAMVRGLKKAAPEEETSAARLRLALLVDEELKRRLRTLAEGADTTTPEGLAALLDEAVVLLLREAPAWRWAEYETRSLGASEAFEGWMAEERSLFQETFRHFQGERTEAPYTPRLEAGGRYLVVSLIALRSGAFPPVVPLSKEAVKERLLAFAATTSATLLGAYLAWTPEKEGEALTEEELLALYPRLYPI